MASYSLVPRDGADFRATLESLQLNFEEFRYFFESESEIGLWVQKLSLGEHQSLQTARLRRISFSMPTQDGLRFLRQTWMISSMRRPFET